MSNKSWTTKLKISFGENLDGNCSIVVDWDETDADLNEWNSWDDNKKREFIIKSISIAVYDALNNHGESMSIDPENP